MLIKQAVCKSTEELDAAVYSSFSGIEATLVQAIIENNCTVKGATIFLEHVFQQIRDNIKLRLEEQKLDSTEINHGLSSSGLMDKVPSQIKVDIIQLYRK